MDFKDLTIKEVGELYSSKSINFKELIELQIKHINKTEEKILSLVNFSEKEYLELANLHEGLSINNLTLSNIPIAVKDLIDVKKLKTEANSESLKNNIAEKDASVVKILKEKGAFIGMKTNTHEYAYGAVSPPTKNPWNLSAIPGGSSGGSAASVSSGIALGSLGSDTAGSIREPAALCSVVGFKPTYNLIPLNGVVPLAWTLDVVGPITKTVTDCAIMFSALDKDYKLNDIDINKKNYKLGILSEYFGPMEEGIKDSYKYSLEILDKEFECEQVDSWNVDEVISTIFLILTAESAAFLKSPIEKNPKIFGGDVKQFVEMGGDFSAVEYINAQRARRAIVSKVDLLFNDFDFLIAPSQLMEPPSAENDTVDLGGNEEPRDLNLIKPLVLSSLCGYPSISIPFVQKKNRSRFSIQVIANRGLDNKLLDFSRLLEEKFQLNYKHPTGY